MEVLTSYSTGTCNNLFVVSTSNQLFVVAMQRRPMLGVCVFEMFRFSLRVHILKLDELFATFSSSAPNTVQRDIEQTLYNYNYVVRQLLISSYF